MYSHVDRLPSKVVMKSFLTMARAYADKHRVHSISDADHDAYVQANLSIQYMRIINATSSNGCDFHGQLSPLTIADMVNER